MDKVKKGTIELRDKLISNLNSVFRPGSGSNMGMALEFPHLFSDENMRNTYYIEEDGKIVSQASVFDWKCNLNGYTLKVASLGSVSTLPEYRHRGLSTKVIREVVKDKTDNGFHLLLVSGEIDLYKKIGCAKTGKVLIGTLNGEINQFNNFKTVRIGVSDRKERSFEYHKLYALEKFRYFRTPDLSKILIDSLWFKRESAVMELYEVRSSNEIQAYVVAYRQKKERTVKVMEYAGNRKAIIESLSFILKDLEGDWLKFNVNLEDLELISLCKELNISTTSSYAQGTLMCLDVNGLEEIVNSIVREKLGWDFSATQIANETWRVSIESKDYIITGRSQLTDFIFGWEDEKLAINMMFTDDLSYI